MRISSSTPTSPDPSGETLREVVLAGLDLEEEMVSRLQELHERTSPLEPSPFQEAINSFVVEHGTSYIDVQRHQANNNPEGDRPSTVAEVFSIMDNVHMVRLRMGGMFLRALAEDSSVKLEAEATFADWCAEEPQTARPDRSRSMSSWQFRRMRSSRLSRTGRPLAPRCFHPGARIRR